jgi:hypothetical protein
LTYSSYLFDTHDGFVSKVSSHFDLAATCLTYLSFAIFDDELEDDEIAEFILLGQYRLFFVFAFQWAEIVRRYATALGDQHIPNEFADLMGYFVQTRENQAYEYRSEEKPNFGDVNAFLEFPELLTIMRRSLSFSQLDKSNWRLDEGKTLSKFPRQRIMGKIFFIHSNRALKFRRLMGEQ